MALLSVLKGVLLAVADAPGLVAASTHFIADLVEVVLLIGGHAGVVAVGFADCCVVLIGHNNHPFKVSILHR